MDRIGQDVSGGRFRAERSHPKKPCARVAARRGVVVRGGSPFKKARPATKKRKKVVSKKNPRLRRAGNLMCVSYGAENAGIDCAHRVLSIGEVSGPKDMWKKSYAKL